MIERLKKDHPTKGAYVNGFWDSEAGTGVEATSPYEIVDKVNEIIDYLNRLETLDRLGERVWGDFGEMEEES